MTTLKDKIRDIVVDYHKEKDVADDPEVLIENIVDAISDEIRNYLDKILK